MKHTQSPWTAVQGDGYFIVETSDQSAHFIVQGLNQVGDRANACLVAAAPELLSELQECRNLLGSLGSISRNNFENLAMERLDAITTLIAKATGEQK